jgi:hypothetical protein
VHDVPPVEVMRTVVAVTAPFEAVEPKALTQSPIARSPTAADWVAVKVVDPDVVILRLAVFGATGLLFLELLDFVGRVRLPGVRRVPDMERDEPLTPVTLPDAMLREARPGNRRCDPAGNEGLVPPARNPKPPAPVDAPPPARDGPVQAPVEDGVKIVMLRAAIVVLDDFDAVPVTLTQSPAARELTASDTVLENWVVPVQLTVVWPVFGACTSMLEVDSAATLPLAPLRMLVGAVAAPAADPTVVAATSAVAPVPIHRAQRRRLVLRLVSVCMWDIPLSFFLLFVS